MMFIKLMDLDTTFNCITCNDIVQLTTSDSKHKTHLFNGIMYIPSSKCYFQPHDVDWSKFSGNTDSIIVYCSVCAIRNVLTGDKLNSSSE